MKLNFGHTFAHALEAKNKYSNKLNHGEAVLLGMLIATKFQYAKCSKEIYELIKYIRNYQLIIYLLIYLSKKLVLQSNL